MIALLMFAIVFGTIATVIVSFFAYAGGTDDKRNAVKYPSLYGTDTYNNTYIVPFNYVYDAGYAAYDKRKSRAERNKEHFKNKEDK